MTNMYASPASIRRSPPRTHHHLQQFAQHQHPGSNRGASRHHAWLQSSVARRLLAESQFMRRPSTEPASDERSESAGFAVGRATAAQHDKNNSNNNLHAEAPGITADGRYLPSSKAKFEAASAALQRRRSMGGQKFYSVGSNNFSGYTDEPGFDYDNRQHVPITAWNQPAGISGFSNGARDRGYTLPENVTLVTLEEAENGDVLLRLAHLYEEGEHRELSRPAYIDIRHLFQGCQVTSACEMDLSATQFKGNLPDLVIELRCMQVRTFLLTIQ